MYDQQAPGGAAIWTETWDSGTSQVTVTDGVFQVALGTHVALPGSVDFNTDNIYLGVEFNGDGEMDSRIRFTAVPYAFNADKIHGLTVTDTTGILTIPNGKTIQFADAFTTSGAFPLTLTTTASTTATLPTGTITLVDTATSQVLTNKTIGSTGLTISGAATDITTATDESLVVVANGAGTVDIQDATTVDSLTTDTGGISIAANQSYMGAGAVTLSSGGSSGLTLDSASGVVSVATGDYLALSHSGVSGATSGYIWYDTGDNKFKINENGSTKVICNTTDAGCGAGASTTLKSAYDNDADGSDATIELSSTDGSIIISNPTSSGTGSAFAFKINQQNTTANVSALDIIQASNAANALNLTANAIDTETGLAIIANGLTSGSALTISSSSTVFTGNLVDITLSGSNNPATGSLLAINNTGTNNANTGLYIKHYATGTNNLAMRVDDVSGDTTPFVIDGSGNVGIGTSTPTAQLHAKGSLNTPLSGTVTINIGTNNVVGSGTSFDTEISVGDSFRVGSEIFTVSSISSATVLTLDSNTAVGYAGDTAYKDSNLFAIDNGDGVNKVVVDKMGNVGIGDASPDAYLDIDSTRKSGTLFGILDSTTITGSIIGQSITLSGSGAFDQTGLQFNLSGASGTNLNDVVGSSSTWKVSRAGVGTFVSGTSIGSQTFTTNNIADSGALTIASGTASALTLNSGTTGTIGIGTDSSDETINISTGGAVKTLTIGSTNTTSTTKIQSGSGNIGLEANGTGTGNVQIGDGGTASATPDLLVMDTGSAEPTGTNGAMYYSTSSNKFRCYENSAWKDCDTTGSSAVESVTVTTFTSDGTWTKSNYADLQFVQVITTAGGGGGGGMDGDGGNEGAAGGGGAGGTAIEILNGSALGSTESVAVSTTGGAGGTGDGAGGTGVAGGAASFGTTPYNSATGGNGGVGAQSTTTCLGVDMGVGGTGGSGSNGTINVNGQAGGNPGTCIAELVKGGTGGASYWGGGGVGGSSEAANSCNAGGAANAYGAGGGGAADEDQATGCNGGEGTDGIVVTMNYRASGGDLAEWYETKSDVEVGDVVSISGDLLEYDSRLGLEKTSILEKAVTGSSLVGVVSSVPFEIMGNDILSKAEHPQPIALVGRVPVKVSEENGKIMAGDTLTVSSLVPGFAMRSTKSGRVIGTALNDSNCVEGETCKVLVMVETTYSTGALLKVAYRDRGIDLSTIPGDINVARDISRAVLVEMLQDKERMTETQDISEVFTDRLAAGLEVITPRVTTQEIATDTLRPSLTDTVSVILETDGSMTIGEEGKSPATSIDALGNADFSGTVTAKVLRADRIEGLEVYAGKIAQLEESMISLGEEKNVEDAPAQDDPLVSTPDKSGSFDRLSVGVELKSIGKIIASGGIVISEEAEFQGDVFFRSIAQFFNRAEFGSEVVFKKSPTFSSDTAGFASIKAGDRWVDVKFDQEYARQPIISVTLTNEESPLYKDAIQEGDKDFIKDLQNVDKKFIQSIFDDDVRFVVTKKSTNGFSIVLNKEVKYDVLFSWMALAVDDAKTSLSYSSDFFEENLGEKIDVLDVESAPVEKTLIEDDSQENIVEGVVKENVINGDVVSGAVEFIEQH